MTPWGVFFLAFYNVLLVNGGTLSTESKWNGFKKKDAGKAVAFRGFLTKKPSLLDVKTAFWSFKTDSKVP